MKTPTLRPRATNGRAPKPDTKRIKPTHVLHTQRHLDDALARLVAADRRLAPVFKHVGTPDLRRRPAGFEGLVQIVVGQQLSTSSALAIWGRLVARFHPFDATAIRAVHEAELASLGLSRAKIKTLKVLADAVLAGDLNFDELATMDADEAHKRLVALHGIGPWTADVYLLFCLGNADAWPAGDLAVQEGVRLGLGLKTRPSVSEMQEIAQAWRPDRGAAAHLWWAFYRMMKKREGIPLPVVSA